MMWVFRRYGPYAVVALIGIGSTLILYHLAATEDERRVQSDLAINADWRATDMAWRLALPIEPVLAVAGALGLAHDDGDLEDVMRVADRFRGTGLLRALGWQPRIIAEDRENFERQMQERHKIDYRIFEVDASGRRVPAPQRSEYFPIAGGRRYAGPPLNLGLNATFEPMRTEMMLTARDTGSVTVSQPILSTATGQYSAFYFAPVYRGGSIPATIDERRSQLLGILAGVSEVSRLFNNSLAGAPESQASIYIASGRDGAGRPSGIFARYTPHDGRFSFTAVTESIDLSALPGRLIERPIHVADRTWTAIIHYPTAVIDASHTSGLWGILVAGFALTALVIILLNRETMRTDHAEKAVAAATGELRQSATFLRAVLDNTRDAVVSIDRQRKITGFNKRAEAVFGYVADEMIGQAFNRLIPELHQQPVARPLHGLNKEVEGTRKDGSVFPLDLNVTEIEIAGEPGVVATMRDLTQQKLLESQLVQSQKMEAVGQLTGGVAHDFNNLLGVISGNLELLGEALPDRPDLHGRLQTALNATDRGATLTRSLLAFARRQPLEPRIVDLNALMREMAELLRRTVQENIEIEFVSGAGIWPCEADPGQLQNALLNLVVNARDAMLKGGRLTIETGNVRLDDEYAAAHADVTPGQYVMLAVSDTGSGIPPHILTRVFEPFFTTKEVGKGTGLGLSMVYGFVKQSRGHVKIYSEVSHGTTVRIYLPRGTSANEQPDRTLEPMEAGARGETILMVEDDPDMRTLGRALLNSLGYEVLDAEDAHEALRLLQMKTASLLLTDVMLRGDMNGRQLAEEACRRQPGLRVLYMSGYTENAIIHHGRLDQGVHLLQKPFRKRDLAAKVRAVLDEAAPS
jgi:PAS domain S-box-containing protein